MSVQTRLAWFLSRLLELRSNSMKDDSVRGAYREIAAGGGNVRAVRRFARRLATKRK